MDITEIAKHTGVPASTLRFYEEKGLVKSIGRRGLRRLFHVNIIERLSLIALGRNAGFSLAEISSMFAANGMPQVNRRQLAEKADELDRKIKQLVTMRDGLRHAANCPEPSHMECPKFRKMMRIAGKKARPYKV